MIYTERLVPGRRVKALEKERDTWQNVALKAMGHADALQVGAEVTTSVVRALGDATSSAVGRALAGAPDESPGGTEDS